ncbi:hypothetical protein CROQUDRAFT_103222 [Cronartium quercuum f. sp. fusiforme G11]|uniref:Uncharacterized protein n=1 Tax=Cronartium quercuum f. sp. fusiforme G11 TaxID=708437 RepID=A0A9P6NVA7_9BASI|nr:hypothetical protein CROQUDRAFT_103222 [Cronartium quercuum f. sp. fusiforme G11]
MIDFPLLPRRKAGTVGRFRGQTIAHNFRRQILVEKISTPVRVLNPLGAIISTLVPPLRPITNQTAALNNILRLSSELSHSNLNTGTIVDSQQNIGKPYTSQQSSPSPENQGNPSLPPITQNTDQADNQSQETPNVPPPSQTEDLNLLPKLQKGQMATTVKQPAGSASRTRDGSSSADGGRVLLAAPRASSPIPFAKLPPPEGRIANLSENATPKPTAGPSPEEASRISSAQSSAKVNFDELVLDNAKETAPTSPKGLAPANFQDVNPAGSNGNTTISNGTEPRNSQQPITTSSNFTSQNSRLSAAGKESGPPSNLILGLDKKIFLATSGIGGTILLAALVGCMVHCLRCMKRKKKEKETELETAEILQDSILGFDTRPPTDLTSFPVHHAPWSTRKPQTSHLNSQIYGREMHDRADGSYHTYAARNKDHAELDRIPQTYDPGGMRNSLALLPIQKRQSHVHYASQSPRVRPNLAGTSGPRHYGGHPTFGSQGSTTFPETVQNDGHSNFGYSPHSGRLGHSASIDFRFTGQRQSQHYWDDPELYEDEDGPRSPRDRSDRCSEQYVLDEPLPMRHQQDVLNSPRRFRPAPDKSSSPLRAMANPRPSEHIRDHPRKLKAGKTPSDSSWYSSGSSDQQTEHLNAPVPVVRYEDLFPQARNKPIVLDEQHYPQGRARLPNQPHDNVRKYHPEKLNRGKSGLHQAVEDLHRALGGARY